MHIFSLQVVTGMRMHHAFQFFSTGSKTGQFLPHFCLSPAKKGLVTPCQPILHSNISHHVQSQTTVYPLANGLDNQEINANMVFT